MSGRGETVTAAPVELFRAGQRMVSVFVPLNSGFRLRFSAAC
jgi:hypothetical protein